MSHISSDDWTMPVEPWEIMDVPSLRGMVKVSICGGQDIHSLTFYSAIHQMVQSLTQKGWECGTVSITLSKADDGTLQAYTLVTRSDMTAT